MADDEELSYPLEVIYCGGISFIDTQSDLNVLTLMFS
jgi:hypothetical protein